MAQMGNEVDALTKIRWEGKQLLPNQHVKCVNRRVPEVLVIVKFSLVMLLGDAEVAARFRDVHLVSLHGSMVAMVTVVRNLPAEVRRPQKGMDRLGRPENTLAAASKPFRGDNTRYVRSQSDRTRIGSQRRRRGHTAKGKGDRMLGMGSSGAQKQHGPHDQSPKFR